MAIQANATKSTHNHNGNGLNGPKLDQANTHQNPDTNKSTSSLHHTIGTGSTQAAAGNHTHSQYVDLSSTQTITGKKTFPTGSKSPVIGDFSYSKHAHGSAEGGGPIALTLGNYFTTGYLNGSDTRKQLELISNSLPIDIPTGYHLVGEAMVQVWATSLSGDFYYVSAAVSFGPKNVTYQDAENITWMGFTDNGYSSNARFAKVGGYSPNVAQNMYTISHMNIPYQVYIPDKPKAVNLLKLFIVNQTPGTSYLKYSVYNKYWMTANYHDNPTTWNF